MIQTAYSINLIPGYYAIAELLTTCGHSGFWQNEHVFSCFTVLVTVSKCGTLEVLEVKGDSGRSIIHE